MPRCPNKISQLPVVARYCVGLCKNHSSHTTGSLSIQSATWISWSWTRES